MHIVLVDPEIPQNAGNISRTCVLTSSTLHFVGRMGFSLENRYLKRAGLDYWPYLNYYLYDTLNELFRWYCGHNFYFLSTRGKRLYTEVSYTYDDFLIFGKETEGLPQWVINKYWENTLRIPMTEGIPRSLNLSNSVAVVLFEALRQLKFPYMK